MKTAQRLLVKNTELANHTAEQGNQKIIVRFHFYFILFYFIFFMERIKKLVTFHVFIFINLNICEIIFYNFDAHRGPRVLFTIFFPFLFFSCFTFIFLIKIFIFYFLFIVSYFLFFRRHKSVNWNFNEILTKNIPRMKYLTWSWNLLLKR